MKIGKVGFTFFSLSGYSGDGYVRVKSVFEEIEFY